MLPTRGGRHYPHRVTVVPRTIRFCLLALVLLAGATGVASAQTPGDEVDVIFLDYAVDQSIDGDYTAVELAAALRRTDGDVAYRDFERAVQGVYDRDILGLSQDGPSFSGSSSTELPAPRAPGDRPPWPLLALTALAGALVLSGLGSSIVRRVRR